MDDLQRVARGDMTEEERRRALQAGANVSRFEVDADNVVPYVPHTDGERMALGLGGRRYPPGRSRPD